MQATHLLYLSRLLEAASRVHVLAALPVCTPSLTAAFVLTLTSRVVCVGMSSCGEDWVRGIMCDKINEQTCLNQCSGHGECDSGYCRCAGAWRVCTWPSAGTRVHVFAACALVSRSRGALYRSSGMIERPGSPLPAL